MTRRAWDIYREAVSSHVAWAVTGVVELRGGSRRATDGTLGPPPCQSVSMCQSRKTSPGSTHHCDLFLFVNGERWVVAWEGDVCERRELDLRSVNRLVADWLDVGRPLVSLPAGRANGRDGVNGWALGNVPVRNYVSENSTQWAVNSGRGACRAHTSATRRRL